MPHIKSNLKPRQFRIAVIAPKDPGSYALQLHVMSDTYLNCDWTREIILNVVPRSESPLKGKSVPEEVEAELVRALRARLPPELPNEQAIRHMREFMRQRKLKRSAFQKAVFGETASNPAAESPKTDRKENDNSAIDDRGSISLKPCTKAPARLVRQSSFETVSQTFAEVTGKLRSHSYQNTKCPSSLMGNPPQKPIRKHFDWSKRAEIMISDSVGLDRLAIDTLNSKLWSETCDPEMDYVTADYGSKKTVEMAEEEEGEEGFRRTDSIISSTAVSTPSTDGSTLPVTPASSSPSEAETSSEISSEVREEENDSTSETEIVSEEKEVGHHI